jgi:hypothetical protein
LSLTQRKEHRLRVCENRALRKIFVPKRDESNWTGGDCTVRGVLICALHEILLEWSNQEKLGGQGVWHDGGKEKGMKGFGGKTSGKEITW